MYGAPPTWSGACDRCGLDHAGGGCEQAADAEAQRLLRELTAAEILLEDTREHLADLVGRCSPEVGALVRARLPALVTWATGALAVLDPVAAEDGEG